ncbi:hypothetical protein TsFJ059_010130 [Trichoderma semiorbis]|uniref:Sequence orphan n=1 Tax=Trichoderma semiorbis TaxID=1491008 RepID=A0A9P8HL49_9HYPO|nr:hypothetical protein TsFJ059_010130 [Trichoderma semiorbis]
MKTDDAVSQSLASRMPGIASAITTTTTTTGTNTNTRDDHHLPIAITSTSQSHPQSKWNTDRLAWRLGADATSAACAGALIAPIITIIDRSIMENASGRNTLAASIRSSLTTLLTRPQSFFFSRPCALVFALYGGTYMTANALDTAASTISNRPAGSVTSGPGKFTASSAANVGLCVYKDQVFVRLFGPPGAVPRPVPLPSYVLFTMRDCLTIFASFNLPPLLAPWMDARLSDKMGRYVSGLTAAQFIAPASVQLFSTPVHLLGLDMYNRPNGSWRQRWQVVRSNWLISTAARMCRIIPAFGVGGVVNTKTRRHLIEKIA